MSSFRITDHEARTSIATCNACGWRSSESHMPKVMVEARDHALAREGHIVTAISTLVKVFKRVTAHGSATDRERAIPRSDEVE